MVDAGWAHRHPGRGCFPISLYGDEAKYNLTYGDKFIALCLGSPLVQKAGFLPQEDCIYYWHMGEKSPLEI